MLEKYTDSTIMPWGAHKGKRLIDVPGSYLLWLYREKKQTIRQPLIDYIEDNIEVLKKEG